ncbi:tetratricopeptide repeat protein, partial [candidate division KSB1 bacterium]|nr:tetratricopeptide repeat protein [candidate division KSB1 bacterium]NIR72442.1 tetratricopeptide repeat protein [candidate division KSB1 bacterium]NIS23939.1 tetratricopeptide repeat protein [candidate division KSB1 bacterium]NIT70856.1 tetratricopeptide repeat protein [candidate division KSB1 bacterium]NIU24587.1 tetratricopeptide repeat protein [candidate division KSB1 bacterium]
PTLGEIYAAQGQYAKAIDVFELLLKKHPDNESYAKKIEMLKKKLEESKDAPKN